MAPLVFKTSDTPTAYGGFDSHPLPPIASRGRARFRRASHIQQLPAEADRRQLAEGYGTALKLADRLAAAAAKGRRLAAAFPASTRRDDLPWAVIADFDAEVRGHLARDPRVEDERDRVLIAAVKLAQTPGDAEPEDRERARRELVRAVDYLEQAVLRFGLLNRQAAKRGYGAPGDPVSDTR